MNRLKPEDIQAVENSDGPGCFAIGPTREYDDTIAEDDGLTQAQADAKEIRQALELRDRLERFLSSSRPAGDGFPCGPRGVVQALLEPIQALRIAHPYAKFFPPGVL